VFNDANGKYKTSGFEYESIWAMGADCCVDNLDQIAEAPRHLESNATVGKILVDVA
jgi:aldehyde:ferredoxin oxidoreductase